MHTLLPLASLPILGSQGGDPEPPIDWAYADEGGTITEQDGWRIHVFTDAGADSINFTAPGLVEYLCVGGGGGGGLGGGGGGGEVKASAVDGPLLVEAGPLSVHVGAKGLGCVGYPQVGGTPGTSGESSWIGDIEALGGGRGGTYHSSDQSEADGADGGSGGGGGSWDTGNPLTPADGGEAIGTGLGNDGGDGITREDSHSGGGGGGATEPGGSAVPSGTVTNVGGPGGEGYESDITGESDVYGSGGGGYGIGATEANRGAAGTNAGRGGVMTVQGALLVAGEDAVENTGSGGGASYGSPFNSSTPVCGDGADGIVVIRYRISG